MPREAAGHGDDSEDDTDGMPALVTSDESDGNSDGNSLPDLDNSNADSLPDLDCDHDSNSDSLPDLEADHDSGISDDLSEEDDDDDDDYDGDGLRLPDLVDFPPPRFPGAAAGAQIGPNTPLNLDQQAAVDDLSHQLDVADALAASVRLVRLWPNFFMFAFLACMVSINSCYMYRCPVVHCHTCACC